MVLLSLVVVLFLPVFATLVVPGFSGTDLSKYILYTRILMIQPIFLGLSTLISTLAQSRHQFYLYGIAPLIYTLTIICSIVFGYNKFGASALVFGVLLGAVLLLANTKPFTILLFAPKI